MSTDIQMQEYNYNKLVNMGVITPAKCVFCNTALKPAKLPITDTRINHALMYPKLIAIRTYDASDGKVTVHYWTGSFVGSIVNVGDVHMYKDTAYTPASAPGKWLCSPDCDGLVDIRAKCLEALEDQLAAQASCKSVRISDDIKRTKTIVKKVSHTRLVTDGAFELTAFVGDSVKRKYRFYLYKYLRVYVPTHVLDQWTAINKKEIKKNDPSYPYSSHHYDVAKFIQMQNKTKPEPTEQPTDG